MAWLVVLGRDNILLDVHVIDNLHNVNETECIVYARTVHTPIINNGSCMIDLIYFYYYAVVAGVFIHFIYLFLFYKILFIHALISLLIKVMILNYIIVYIE